QLLPSAALLALREQARADPDKTALDALDELLTPFPPGCFVKLANNEVALVTRRGLDSRCPKVQVVVNAKGAPMFGSLRRETNVEQFRPVSLVPSIALPSVNMAALWH